MTVKSRIIRVFKALVLCLLFASSPVLAQNNMLPTNVSTFNIGTVGNGHSGNNLNNAGVTTNYSYVSWENGLLADDATQCYAVGTNARYYGNGHNSLIGDYGLFSLGDHTTGNGNYMIVNGSTSSNKKVWEYTVQNISPGVIYQFKVYVTCLFMTPGGIAPTSNYLPKLQLKINDQDVGQVKTLTWTNGGQWTSWSQEWTAGSNTTSAKITIIDNCTSDNGNDFGLDDIVFKMADGYSLIATDFTETFCGEITPIDLTNHYTMTYPSGGNSAPPMQVKIRKNSSFPWETSITTNHGTAYVGSDNKIYYTPNEGYYGPDDFRYQISRFGLVAEKRIDVNVFGAPSNCTPQGLPANNLLCISEISSFNPSATWVSNGSTINPSGWLYKKIGVTDWEPGSNFQSWVTQWGGLGEYSIKFYAENSCGRQESDPYNFNICDVPEWITQPTASSICTGSAEPTVSINWNYNTGVQTWQYKRGNGNWTDFVWGEFDLLPGDQVRYRVTYDACNGNPLTSQTINVVSGPQFNSSIPVSFEEGYCPNSQVSLPQIQSSWYNAYGMSVTPGWYYVNYDPSGSPSYVPITGNTITLNNGSVSVTPCLQNDECGFTPFFPAFDLIVWDEPAIQGLENLPDSLGPVCSGTSLSSILPELSPDGHFTVSGWEISAGQNPSGFQSNLPQTLSASDNGRWLRYRVQTDCGQYDDETSDPIRVWVGAAPTLNTTQINPLGTVCDGTLVTSLVDVHVTNWNLFEGVEQWEVNLNGTWTAFTQFELSHNGCQVRYYAQNQCGEAIVSAGTVSVTEGPSFNSPGASLGLEDYYCDGNSLNLPTPPGIDGHGINVNDEYWAYFDGAEYHRITSTPQLDESWNGYQITYVLESDCGGEIYYPTPFTLVVKGQPEVEISLDGSNTFCVGTPLSLDAEVDWHLCTQNTQASSWQYAPANQPNNYSDFNPIVGIPEAGTFLVNYHAVANECGFDAYGAPLTVTVEAAPEFVNAVQFELGRFCEDDLLQLPSNPVVSGHVDESGWQISVGYDPSGEYTEIDPGHVLTLSDNGRWLRYYVIGCSVYIHHEEEIYVDGKPMEEYNIADRICKGQFMSFQLISTNGYPVTQWEWRIGSTSGNVFNPYEYTFNDEGEYLIYYRVGNDCGWSDYMGPLPLLVTAGPEFDNSTLPTESQYVCEGTTVGELLQQSGITAPSLVDPGVPHNAIGWFINGQPVDLSTEIIASYHNAGLSYAVRGDCSDVPVYSGSVTLHVYGRPVVTQIPSIDWEFCDGDAVQLPDPEIDFQNGEGLVNGSWQIQSADGTWEDLPTTWTANHNGAHVRYHLNHSVCLDLGNDSEEIVISVHSAPVINDEDLPSNNLITICFGSSLGVDEPEVQPEQNESGWQVSANGTDWGTALEGHAFDPNHVDDYFNGKYLRYHAESTQCPNLEDNSQVYTIQLMDSPTINDEAWPEQVSYCSGGSLGIETPNGLPGEWQVSSNGTNWGTELEGYAFDPSHIDDFFDGKFLRYFVHTSCGDDESKVMTLFMKNSEQAGMISGLSNVYVASSLISGIYRYEIDMEGLAGSVSWSLSNPDWQIVEQENNFCRILVTMPGMAILTAHFNLEECGEMERSFEINAGFYGVDDFQGVDVHIFPNPTKGSVTIETEGIESLRLIDMMGQVLEMREYDRSDSVMLNLSAYIPSVYLLEIKTVYGVVKKRLVLCR